MIKTVILDRDQRPIEEMFREIWGAVKREIVFDEDQDRDRKMEVV